MRKLSAILLSLFLLFQGEILPAIASPEHTYDIVIKGGTIVNPATEHKLENYYIGINGSTIKQITKETISGKHEIDATGLVVSPGFIDLISYDPNWVGIELKVLDGVTTNLAMHGGTEDAASWYETWGNNGVLTNFGASSFITRLRWPIIGQDIFAEMTDDNDIEQLVQSVKENIEAGALGISFSLEYVPGVKHEIEPLLELAAQYDLPTFYHLRYSDEEKGLKGVQEVIELGEKTGAPIHIMHINSTGGTFVMDEALDMVDKAKQNGLDITTDFYPYDFWATYLGSARFLPGWEERFKISFEDLQIAGTNERISAETFASYREQNTLVAALGSMPEDELYMLLKHPDTMVGSDTIIEPHYNNHPRGAGAFSRLFGKYVREEQVLSLMDAVKKASYFPAKRMEKVAPAMRNKGRIEIGADADLTIFNPETIIDQSTVENTATPSVGIEYVIINGVITKDQSGLVDEVSPGEPIMSYFADDTAENPSITYKILFNDQTNDMLDNIYNIDDETFFPLYETFNLVNLHVDDHKNGQIDIGDFINLEIGDQIARVNEEMIELSTEPVLYKENIYLSLLDIYKLLESQYTINEVGRHTLQFEAIKEESHDESDDVIAQDAYTHTDTKDTTINYTLYIIVGSIFVILMILMITLRRSR